MATSKTTFTHDGKTYMFLSDGESIVIASTKRGEKITFRHLGKNARHHSEYTRCSYSVSNGVYAVQVEGDFLLVSNGHTQGYEMHHATEEEITNLASAAARHVIREHGTNATTEHTTYEEMTALRAYALLHQLVPMDGHVSNDACIAAALASLADTDKSGDIVITSNITDEERKEQLRSFSEKAEEQVLRIREDAGEELIHTLNESINADGWHPLHWRTCDYEGAMYEAAHQLVAHAHETDDVLDLLGDSDMLVNAAYRLIKHLNVIIDHTATDLGARRLAEQVLWFAETCYRQQHDTTNTCITIAENDADQGNASSDQILANILAQLCATDMDKAVQTAELWRSLGDHIVILDDYVIVNDAYAYYHIETLGSLESICASTDALREMGTICQLAMAYNDLSEYADSEELLSSLRTDIESAASRCEAHTTHILDEHAIADDAIRWAQSVA